jgi:hypothetical protein
MGRPAKIGGRKRCSVQLCGFVSDLHRKTARSLTENNKIAASAAVLAFSRLSRDEQVELCAEVRRLAPPVTEGA